MRIKKMTFTDKFRKLAIKETSFDALTLLVGVSGAGKTQILRAILTMQDIAKGGSANGIKWSIEFESTTSGGNYIWEGQFETVKGIYDEPPETKQTESIRKKPSLLSEKLFLNGEEIISRQMNSIVFYGNPTVKLSSYESIIYLLREEEQVLPAFRGFSKIILSSYNKNSDHGLYMPGAQYVKELEQHYRSPEDIRELDEHFKIKLYLASKFAPELFETISERFREIFPQVESIKVDIFETDKEYYNIYENDLIIQLKEKEVPGMILEHNISSGMYRVLKHLSEIYLSSKGTVILIDEFENSLGVNCIDELTSDLFSDREQNIQFIITSHHPYIINNISHEFWKIVTRDKGNIITHNSSDLNIGRSRHEAFLQLINNPEFFKGIKNK